MKPLALFAAAITLAASSSLASANDQKTAPISQLIGMPNPVYEHMARLPHHHLVGAMNLCAHAVQMAAEKGAITKESVEQKLSLCGQGRFHDVHELIASPEPTVIYRHPFTGRHHVIPKWLLHIHGLPEGATHQVLEP